MMFIILITAFYQTSLANWTFGSYTFK